MKALLDFHGFLRETTVEMPPPPKLASALTMRLRGGTGYTASEVILESNEDGLGITTMQFRLKGHEARGVVYTCDGCLICRPSMTATEITRLSQTAARAAIDQYEALKADHRRRVRRRRLRARKR